MALGRGYVEAFDNLINSIFIEPLGKALGGALGKIADIGEGIGGALTGGVAAIGASFGAVGHALSGGGNERGGPAIAPAEPSVAINTPAQSVDRFTVSMSDLGTFSPQNFAGQSISQGQGAGMSNVG